MPGGTLNVGVFVLGMARSGTSAVTRVVNMLGIAVAEEADRKPTDGDNPRGYWESKSLTRLNRRLLTAVAGDPAGPAPRFPPGWESDTGLAELRREARALINRVHASSPWVWKDPRTCLTLPFWVQVAEVDPVVVLIYRHPLEVADSLARRDDAPVPISLAVWERYNRAALANAAGLPVFVLRYERLVEEPRVVASELAAFLRSRGVEVHDPGDELETFVDPALRRSRGDDETRSSLSEEQVELLGVLKALEGAHAQFAAPELPAETPWVDPLLDAERRIGILELLRERRSSLKSLEAQMAHRSALGLEVRLRRGSPAWRLLSPVRRLLVRG